MGIDYKNPTPLYQQIVDDIKNKISSNQLKVGELIGSQKEIAQKYGVSLITARKAMAILINEGILVSRVGKGMYVARKSASIDFSKYKTIGLVLRDLQDPFFSRIVHSVEACASEHGFNILLSNSSEQIDKEEYQIRQFHQMGVEGLIIASMKHIYQGTPTIRKLRDENFPFVMVSYIEDEDIYYVGTDHEQGAFLATEHLIKLGYKRIGYINAEKGSLLGELRKQGFCRALNQHNLDYNDDYLYRLKWNDYQSGYEIGKYFSQLQNKPKALFVFSDISALGFEQAVLDEGMKVPDDVAIVGFDDIERDLYAPVPLTTVHQPTNEIGIRAFDMLLAQINGEKTKFRTILSPKLIVRESCGARRS